MQWTGERNASAFGQASRWINRSSWRHSFSSLNPPGPRALRTKYQREKKNRQINLTPHTVSDPRIPHCAITNLKKKKTEWFRPRTRIQSFRRAKKTRKSAKRDGETRDTQTGRRRGEGEERGTCRRANERPRSLDLAPRPRPRLRLDSYREGEESETHKCYCLPHHRRSGEDHHRAFFFCRTIHLILVDNFSINT